jgi:tetratricopeptide (TPR) repeat protein
VLALLGGKFDGKFDRKRQQRTPPQNTANGTAAQRRWKLRPAFVAAALAVVALFALGLRFYPVRVFSQVPAGALVYLTPVRNQSGAVSFNGLTELIQASLSQSIQVNLLDQGRVGDILQQMTKAPDAPIDQDTGREIAMRAGAARVVFATVTGSNGTYTLHIDIQQPDNTPRRYREHWTRNFTWQQASTSDTGTIPAPLLAEVRSASDWIRDQVGESAHDIARLDAPPEDVTTDSWQALDDYTMAVRLHHIGRDADAVVALRHATQLDPQFALAYGQLADIQLTLHHETEGFLAYKKALDPAIERRLSRRERDRLAGMYAIDNQDPAAAVDSFRDYQTFYPNDRLAWLYSIRPLTLLNRYDEAIANLKRAHTLDPTNPFPLDDLAHLYAVRGDYALAETTLKQADPSGKLPITVDIAGELAFLQGNYDMAAASFTALQDSSDLALRSEGFDQLADLAAERGDYAAAASLFDRGLAEDAAQGNMSARATKLAGRGAMKARLGDYPGCAADLRSAIAANPSPEMFLHVETILGEAIAAAPPSAAPALRREMIALTAHLPAGDYGMITHLLNLRSQGESELAAGHIDAALQHLRELAAIDAPAKPREYLGRALVAAAAVEPSPARVLALRREALQAFAVVALHPGFVWEDPYHYPPGFVADEIHAYLQLADALDDRSPDVQAARTQWVSLRNRAPLRASNNSSYNHS